MLQVDPEKLRFHRRKSAMTLAEVGRLLGGLHKGTISSWECGRYEVAPKYFDQLSEILSVSVEELTYPRQEKTAPRAPNPKIEAKRRFARENLEKLDSCQREQLFREMIDDLPEEALQKLLDGIIGIRYSN